MQHLGKYESISQEIGNALMKVPSPLKREVAHAPPEMPAE